jgi:hypothetical protein
MRGRADRALTPARPPALAALVAVALSVLGRAGRARLDPATGGPGEDIPAAEFSAARAYRHRRRGGLSQPGRPTVRNGPHDLTGPADPGAGPPEAEIAWPEPYPGPDDTPRSRPSGCR